MSSFIANYKPKKRYFWVSKAALALHLVFPEGFSPSIHLWCQRPKNKPSDYHRVEITVIRTKHEAAALRLKWKKIRARRKAELTKS